LLAGLGAACLALRPSGPLAPGEPEEQARLELPDGFGEWQSIALDELILWPDDTLSPAIYRQIVAKRYHHPNGTTVTAVIALASAQNYLMQLHRPESCYPASGFTIEENARFSLPLHGFHLPARFMRARRGSRQDAVLYWTRIGQKFPQDLWGQRLAMAKDALLRDPQTGILARFSVTNEEDGAAESELAAFVQSLFLRLSPEGRTTLFGPAISFDETA